MIASRGLFNASFMSMVTFLPLMLVQVWELSLTAAGMVVAAASLGWSAGSWIQGRTEGDVNTRVRLVAARSAWRTSPLCSDAPPPPPPPPRRAPTPTPPIPRPPRAAGCPPVVR